MKDYNKNVLFSAVSYRRNISNIPFVCKITDTETALGINQSMSLIFSDEFEFKSLKNIPYQNCVKLKDSGILTDKILENKDIATYGISDDYNKIVYVNEEDHIRLLAKSVGLNLESCYSLASELDEKLIGSLNLAFDEKLGYLTSNPQKFGTGLEATVLLFLPALVYNGKWESVASETLKDDYEIYDINLNLFDGKSAFVIIKNKYTFGYKENEIASRMQKLVEKLLYVEGLEEDQLFEMSASKLVDDIFKNYGLAKNSYRISLSDAIVYLGYINWGLNLKVLKCKNKFDICDFFAKIKESNLADEDSSVKEIEKKRAKFFESFLEKNVFKGEVDV